MKKWIAIFLTAAMLICCTSCNMGNIADAVSDAVSEGVSEGMEDINEAVSEGVSNVAEEVNKEITRGTIDGNVYHSDYSGITFTKPDEWVYSSDEQIAEIMNVGKEVLDTNSFQDMALEMSSVYDMAVTDNATGTNMSIFYENLALSNSSDITESEYSDVMMEQLTLQTAMTSEVIDQTTVTISGNEYLRVTCNVDYSGIAMTQVYYLRKIDSFMNGIIVTLIGDYTTDDIEAMFS